MQMLWALVPSHDVSAVQRALRQTHQEFTLQKAHGGWFHSPYTVFWIMVELSMVHSIAQLIHDTSPPRTVPYRSTHGWHTDVWLHPTHITLQGAVTASWHIEQQVAALPNHLPNFTEPSAEQ